jgi:hypothetical protein
MIIRMDVGYRVSGVSCEWSVASGQLLVVVIAIGPSSLLLFPFSLLLPLSPLFPFYRRRRSAISFILALNRSSSTVVKWPSR